MTNLFTEVDGEIRPVEEPEDDRAFVFDADSFRGGMPMVPIEYELPETMQDSYHDVPDGVWEELDRLWVIGAAHDPKHLQALVTHTTFCKLPPEFINHYLFRNKVRLEREKARYLAERSALYRKLNLDPTEEHYSRMATNLKILIEAHVYRMLRGEEENDLSKLDRITTLVGKLRRIDPHVGGMGGHRNSGDPFSSLPAPTSKDETDTFEALIEPPKKQKRKRGNSGSQRVDKAVQDVIGDLLHPDNPADRALASLQEKSDRVIEEIQHKGE